MSAPTFQQAPPRSPVFGSSQPRREDHRFVTGQGRYTDDLCLPGQTWAAFVRRQPGIVQPAPAWSLQSSIPVYTRTSICPASWFRGTT